MSEWTDITPEDDNIFLVDEMRISHGKAITSEGNYDTLVVEATGIDPADIGNEDAKERTIYLTLSAPAERQLKMEMAKWLVYKDGADEAAPEIGDLQQVVKLIEDTEKLLTRIDESKRGRS